MTPESDRKFYKSPCNNRDKQRYTKYHKGNILLGQAQIFFSKLEYEIVPQIYRIRKLSDVSIPCDRTGKMKHKRQSYYGGNHLHPFWRNRKHPQMTWDKRPSLQ